MNQAVREECNAKKTKTKTKTSLVARLLPLISADPPIQVLQLLDPLPGGGATLLSSNDPTRIDDLPELRSAASGPVLEPCGQLDLRLLSA